MGTPPALHCHLTSAPVRALFSRPLQDREERVKRLAEPPVNMHSEGVYVFAELLMKRLFLLREVETAYNRQRTEEKDAVYQVIASKKSLPKVAEVGIRSGVRLVISLLRSQSRVDPELRREALDFFLEILSELPPLGLWGDGSMSLLLDKSFTSVARFLDEIVSGGDDISGDMKSKALKVLLGLGLVRGSLPNILLVTKILMFSNPQYEVRVGQELKQLATSVPDVRLSGTAAPCQLGVDFTGVVTGAGDDDEDESGKGQASVATDGKYVYIHCATGLYKVGSGFQGTSKGVVYKHNAEYRAGEQGWLAFAGGKLWFRSPGTAPAPVEIVDVDTLQAAGGLSLPGRVTRRKRELFFPEVDIHASADDEENKAEAGESKADASADASAPAAAGASGGDGGTGGANGDDDDADSEESKVKPPRLAKQRSPLFSDGRYLYILSQVVESKKKRAASAARGGDGESKGVGADGGGVYIDIDASDSDDGSDSDGEKEGDGDDDDGEDEEDDDEEGGAANDRAAAAAAKKKKVPKYVVDVWDPKDPARLAHVRRVPLFMKQSPEAEQGKEPFDPVMSAQAFKQGSFSTNGRQLLVVYTSSTVAPTRKPTASLREVSFDLSTGKKIPFRGERRPERKNVCLPASCAGDKGLSGAVTYDGVNNLLWGVSCDGAYMNRWLNRGIAPRMVEPSPSGG